LEILSGNNGIETEESWRQNIRSGRAKRRDRSLKDQQSTGRKRAALLYPLQPDSDCEWKNLRYAGGGKHPIVGCTNGKQQARHHGPDKNTLNNAEGNVHRICHTCHNRYHTANDADYNATGPFRKHDNQTKATPNELIDSELYWKSKGKLKKVVD